MNEIELKERLRSFALRAFRVCDALPRTYAGRAIGGQLSRSAPSVGANYRAACRGRSEADFISKLGIAEEEIDESWYWLDLIVAGNLLPSQKVLPLLDEADQLTRIMTASRKTAQRTLRRSKLRVPLSSIQTPKSKIKNPEYA